MTHSFSATLIIATSLAHMHRTHKAAEFPSMHLIPTHSVVLADELEDRDLVVFGELVFSRKLTHCFV